MRTIAFIFFFCIISCKEKISFKKDYNSIKVKDSIVYKQTKKKESLKIKNSIVLDSIYKGAIFYEINSFKDFQYIDIDPYEDFLIDNGNMYNIIVYQNNNIDYAILSVLEENIGMGEHSFEWKNTKKTIIDFLKYPKKYKRCWYFSFINETDIVEEHLYLIQDSISGKFKSWRIDFENQKFIPFKKNIDFECF